MVLAAEPSWLGVAFGFGQTWVRFELPDDGKVVEEAVNKGFANMVVAWVRLEKDQTNAETQKRRTRRESEPQRHGDTEHF